jgi:hypothetical protein
MKYDVNRSAPKNCGAETAIRLVSLLAFKPAIHKGRIGGIFLAKPVADGAFIRINKSP